MLEIEPDMHDFADDPVAQQNKDSIEALNDGEQAELVAGLIQLGLTVEDLEPAWTYCLFRWRGRKTR